MGNVRPLTKQNTAEMTIHSNVTGERSGGEGKDDSVETQREPERFWRYKVHQEHCKHCKQNKEHYIAVSKEYLTL